MARIAVVTDSTAYLPPELVKLYGIHVIPLLLHMEGETLRDGVTIAQPTFYELFAAELSPAIGTHVGPGTVGVAFHTEGAD